jgi:hypothetical protein
MDIIIGFSRSKSPFKLGSKVIQLVEKRPYSHAYIRFAHPTTGSHMIAQASHGYVNIVNNRYFIEENIVTKEYIINCKDILFQETILKYITEHLGQKYGYMQLLLIGIKKLFKFEIKTYNIAKYQICSEFGANICKLLNVSIPENLDYITPSDLEQILINNGIKQVL